MQSSICGSVPQTEHRQCQQYGSARAQTEKGKHHDRADFQHGSQHNGRK
ncbi:hypothetical protein [uncultured Neglectibacter sp.]